MNTEKLAEQFSGETLNEMAMETLEGGGWVDLHANKCTNNCSGGNCSQGCGSTIEEVANDA